MTRFFFLLGLCLSFCSSPAQNTVLAFKHSYGPTVLNADGDTLAFPWSGGFNFCQVSEIDLNLDGIPDLLFFDRSGNRYIPLIYTGSGSSYRYDPGIISFLPQLNNFVLARDIDCDGRADLISYANAGIIIYRNISETATGLNFTLYTPSLLSYFIPATLPVYTIPIDVPAVDDIDGDGDMDVLVFGFNGTCLEYHRNMAMELLGRCDTLMLRLETNNWGKFTEDFSSNAVTLNDSCSSPFGRFGEAHAGSSMLSIDLNGDGVKDLLLGDISYPTLLQLTNGGTPTQAYIVSQELFAGNSRQVNLQVFPAAFSVDVDHDGLKDIIVCPNSESASEDYRCIWYYRNIGNNNTPDYHFVSDTLFVENTLDFGELSMPVFQDLNNDGLPDLVIGNFHYAESGTSRLALLLNVGSVGQPAFRVEDLDFGGLSSIQGNHKNLAPAFVDVDYDGDIDLLLGTSEGTIMYLENIALPGNLPRFQLVSSSFGQIDVGTFARPFAVDVDGDGRTDLLVGNREGIIRYYRNTGAISMQLSLQSDNWGSVKVATEDEPDGFSSPVLFRRNGVSYLLSGNLAGNLFMYGVIPASEEPFPIIDAFALGKGLGDRLSITLSDLNGDGYPEAVVGNRSGGLHFLEGIFPSGIDSPVHQRVVLYPNPGTTILNGFTPNASIRVLDAIGRETRHQADESGGISTEAWTSGIYLILIDEGNTLSTHRWVKP